MHRQSEPVDMPVSSGTLAWILTLVELTRECCLTSPDERDDGAQAQLDLGSAFPWL
jgi:hypothetical protein